MTLAALLDREGDAFAACRDTLLRGAAFRIHPGAVGRRRLFHIYRRRERIARKKGRFSIGFARAVDDLGACRFDRLSIGDVRSETPRCHFQLFLSPDRSQIVACFGIEPASPRQQG